MDLQQLMEINRMFKTLDTNQDGVISFPEYAVMFRQLMTTWLIM
jgi:Ca2+-binding EF-hand superfamily protein